MHYCLSLVKQQPVKNRIKNTLFIPHGGSSKEGWHNFLPNLTRKKKNYKVHRLTSKALFLLVMQV